MKLLIESERGEELWEPPGDHASEARANSVEMQASQGRGWGGGVVPGPSHRLSWDDVAPGILAS